MRCLQTGKEESYCPGNITPIDYVHQQLPADRLNTPPKLVSLNDTLMKVKFDLFLLFISHHFIIVMLITMLRKHTHHFDEKCLALPSVLSITIRWET